jgi:hypothetical protein
MRGKRASMPLATMEWLNIFPGDDIFNSFGVAELGGRCTPQVSPVVIHI